MKKKNRNILIMLAVLVVIGITAVLLLTQPPEPAEENSSSVSSSVSIPIISRAAAEVASVTVENPQGRYVLLPAPKEKISSEETSSETSSEVSAAESPVNFTLQGLEDIPLNTGAVSAAARSLFPLSAVKEIETPDALADFGLAGTGEATLTVAYTDGGSDKLVVGIKSTGTTGRYVMAGDKVYIASSLSESLLGGELSFVDTAVITVPDIKTKDEEGNETAAPDEMEAITFSGSNFAAPIEIVLNENNPNSMMPNKMVAPITADVNSNTLTEITTALKTVSAASAVQVHVTDADLAQYGLDKPYAQVDYTMNGEQHSVKVSEPDEDGQCYLAADGKPIVYQIPAASVSVWTNTTTNSLRASYIFLANIQDVEKLSFKAGDQSYVFEMKREQDEEASGDTPQYTILPSLGGKDIDYKKTYQPMYSALLNVSILSSEPVEYDKTKTPVLSIDYAYFENSNVDHVTFYTVEGQDRYAVEVNGVYSGIVRGTSLNEFLTTLQKAAQNEVLKAD